MWWQSQTAWVKIIQKAKAANYQKLQCPICGDERSKDENFPFTTSKINVLNFNPETTTWPHSLTVKLSLQMNWITQKDKTQNLSKSLEKIKLGSQFDKNNEKQFTVV